MNHLHHPDLPPAASKWSEDQTLHVAACYSNPFRWQTRRQLANDFRRHMMGLPNIDLHMIEIAYGDRPFDIVNPSLYPNDIALRTNSELFHKENLLNLAVRSFPPDWKYGAIIDADFHFTRHDIGLETIHQLQHYDWVQMFSYYQFLSGKTHPGLGHQPIGTMNESFALLYNKYGKVFHKKFNAGWGAPVYSGPSDGKQITHTGAPGGAWAFRRSAFDAVGGLLDRCILGSGDWFMAFGLAGQVVDKNASLEKKVELYNPHYLQYIQAWQKRATDAFHGNIGFVDSFAVHHFHGPIVKRGYSTRDNILVNNKYSPIEDVYPDWQGVLQISPAKPKLRDEVRKYFISRSEDEPNR